MAAEFLARTKVSFVKTAVLSSNDGGNTFNTLKTAIKTDPESQYSEWVANNTPKLSEQFKVAIKNFMEKIDELYKEMKKE